MSCPWARHTDHHNPLVRRSGASGDVATARTQLPGARHWSSLLNDEDDTDPHYAHLYVDRTTWQPGSLDDLLRDVADEVVADVMITNLSVDRIYAPYDGGADVLLPTTTERDTMKRRHLDWLSVHPHGY